MFNKAGLIAFLFLLAGAIAPAKAELNLVELEEAAAIPAFTLSDQNGQVFDLGNLQGRWSLITIGFTHCPDVCPFVLNNLAVTYEQIGLRVRPDNLPQVIFVGVDEARDRPVMKDYVGFFHTDFVGLTGPWTEIATFVEGIDGYASLDEPDADGAYDVRHSASVVVVNPDGNIVAKLSPPIEPGEAAEYLVRRQIEYRRSSQ